MKDFDYYKTTKTPWPRQKDIIRELISELDNIPMTKSERLEKEIEAAQRGEILYKEKFKEYQLESNKLKDEFWRDCREELGYDSFLTKRGCEILESKAWEDGHSYGFSEVYNHLCELSDFADQIIEEKR